MGGRRMTTTSERSTTSLALGVSAVSGLLAGAA